MAVGANAGTVRARLALDSRDFKQKMQEARQEMQSLNKQAQQLKIGQGQIKAGLMAIGTGAVAAIGASIVTAARFEQSMAKVKAISGATGEEFEALKEKAKELGATTSFSATQAADGMALLAAAGFKTNDIINSMEGLLNLAAAAGLDLAQSADYLGSIMSGFGIAAKDSGHAVDVLVKAMNDANTDLPDLAEAMKYVAPVASSMKISFEDTAAAIALMSNYGIKGSQAGTTLRATLLSMANPVGQAKEAMEKLGIEYKKANGEMKSLPEILNHVKEKMQGLTNAQKTQYAAMLVGTEASSGFLALINEGGDKLQRFADGLRAADGAAADMAATMKDTLMGAWDEFTSSIEALGIEIGEEFTPEAKKVVQLATDLVGALSKLNPQFIEMSLKMAAGASAAGLLYFALSKLPLLFRTLQVAMGPWGWISIGLGMIAGAMLDVKDNTEALSETTMTEMAEIAKANRTLEEQANRYDFLRAKLKLTNDEWARYVDLATQLPNVQDPEKVKAMQDEMSKLQKASGLTADELNELVSLNRDLAEKVPDSTAAISEQNNVILKNTDAVRKYTDAKRDELLLELQVRKAKAEANQMENLARQKEIHQEMISLKKELAGLEKDIAEKAKDYKYYQEQALEAEKKGHIRDKMYYEERGVAIAAELDKLNEKKVKIWEHIQGLEKESRQIDKEIGLLNTVDQQMTNIILAQVGLNGKKEDSLRLIDEEIQKTGKLLSGVDEQVKKGKLTKEQAQELVKQYVDHINQLSEAKGLLQEYVGIQDKGGKKSKEQLKAWQDLKKVLEANGYTIDLNTGKVTKLNREVDKTKEKAKETNKELGKKVTKEVKVDDKGSSAKLHKDATKSGTKHVKTDDKGSNAANHKEATKSGTKVVKTDDKGSNSANHKEATKSGTKVVKVDDKGSNAANHKEATKSGTKDVRLKSSNFSDWLSDITSPVTKKVKLVAQKVGDWLGVGKRHSGGTLHELPKYHGGGVVDPPINFGRLGTPPRFDEVDVRLLRNEMVLTQAQQANLFRMIQTFGYVAEQRIKDSFKGDGGGVAPVTIQVASLVVREEADIKRIAEELERLARQRQRARGEY
jgi:TP901 family phage tail tape measure protein